LGFFALDLLRQDRPAQDSHFTKKNTSGLDNVGFIGTENIIGSNRQHPRF
jgi:hypothetical protein